jgi:RNA polymerase sigma factor (sigma-70 family)
MPHPQDSVTQWIDGLRSGDEAAAAELWRRYYRRLKTVAQKKLGDSPRRAADEEDVALSAFQSFCRGVREDRFPDLRDRDDLWRLVVCITERKAYGHLRDHNRKKRGSGMVQGESAFIDLQASNPAAGIDAVAGPEPTPEFAAEMVEAVNRLLAQLADDQLRQIALLKMDGYSNQEIAEKVGRAVTTIERRLRLIRKAWGREAGDE